MIIALPILPGKMQAARDLFKAMERRRSEAKAGSIRYGIKKETWFIQPSPHGDFLLGYLEAKDIEKAMTAWVADQAPFAVWTKEKYKEITGIDFSQPSDVPPPKQVWRHGY